MRIDCQSAAAGKLRTFNIQRSTFKADSCNTRSLQSWRLNVGSWKLSLPAPVTPLDYGQEFGGIERMLDCVTLSSRLVVSIDLEISRVSDGQCERGPMVSLWEKHVGPLSPNPVAKSNRPQQSLNPTAIRVFPRRSKSPGHTAQMARGLPALTLASSRHADIPTPSAQQPDRVSRVLP